MTLICYKIKNPITYNGRDFHDEFLLKFGGEQECARLNEELKNGTFAFGNVNPEEVAYFFNKEDEEN